MTPDLAQACWIAGGLMLAVGITCTLKSAGSLARRIFGMGWIIAIGAVLVVALVIWLLWTMTI